MADFLEERISTAVSRGATRLGQANTEITPLKSGREQRLAVNDIVRRRYNIRYGMTKTRNIIDVMNLFNRTLGSARGFRYKDHLDFKSTLYIDQQISNLDQELKPLPDNPLDTVARRWQLQKIVGSGDTAYIRDINKPVAGSVILNRNEPHVVDSTTGVITFNNPLPITTAVTAGYEYDLPVRFEDDEIEFDQLLQDVSQITSVALVEIII